MSSWGAVAEGLTRWGRRCCERFPFAWAVILCWGWVSVSDLVGEGGCSGGSFAVFRKQPQHSTLICAKAVVKLQETIEVECEAESQGNNREAPAGAWCAAWCWKVTLSVQLLVLRGSVHTCAQASTSSGSEQADSVTFLTKCLENQDRFSRPSAVLWQSVSSLSLAKISCLYIDLKKNILC